MSERCTAEQPASSSAHAKASVPTILLVHIMRFPSRHDAMIATAPCCCSRHRFVAIHDHVAEVNAYAKPHSPPLGLGPAALGHHQLHLVLAGCRLRPARVKRGHRSLLPTRSGPLAVSGPPEAAHPPRPAPSSAPKNAFIIFCCWPVS